MTDKKSLRTAKLAAREALDAAFMASAAAKMGECLQNALKRTKESSISVAVYRSFRHEIDVFHNVFSLKSPQITLCLPVILPNEQVLVFKKFHPDAPLILGKHGIEIPHEDAEIVVPDVVIVPLVAFDKTGHRLGYGAGHYDATIKHLRGQNKNVRIIGAAYSMQEVEKIPADAHDEKLDAVVTEKGMLIPALVAGSGAA